MYGRFIFKLLLAFSRWFVLQIKFFRWGVSILERYDQVPTRLICVEISVVIITNLHVQNNVSAYLLQFRFYKEHHSVAVSRLQ